MGMLTYETVHGQDPVVVAAALSRAGFRVAPKEAPNSHVLEIDWSDDDDHLDREVARSVIADVRTTVIDGPPNLDPEPVEFADEP